MSAARMSDSFIEYHTKNVSKNPSQSSDTSNSKIIQSRNRKTQSNTSNTAATATASSDSPLFIKKNKNTHGETSSVCVKPATSQTVSPRKTRSRSNWHTSTASKSSSANEAPELKKKRSRLCLKVPQMDGASEKLPSKESADSKKMRGRARTLCQKSSDSDSDFAPAPPKRVRSKAAKLSEPAKKPKSKVLDAVKRTDLRVLSTDDDDDDAKRMQKATKITAMDTWIEAYNEKDKKWTVIDPVKNKVDAIDHIRVNS